MKMRGYSPLLKTLNLYPRLPSSTMHLTKKVFLLFNTVVSSSTYLDFIKLYSVVNFSSCPFLKSNVSTSPSGRRVVGYISPLGRGGSYNLHNSPGKENCG